MAAAEGLGGVFVVGRWHGPLAAASGPLKGLSDLRDAGGDARAR